MKRLNHPVKRGKVLAHLKSLSSDIMFLQETHLKNNSQAKLRPEWIGQSYHSTFSAKARGVSILIHKGAPFRHLSTKTDVEGRYLIVTGVIYTTHITLVNLYGPNYDSSAFFKKVFSLLTDISQTNLIIGGDLNCTLDPYLDSSSKKRAPHSYTRDFLKAYIDNSSLTDVWRLFHPSERVYSFHSQVHNVYTRIDCFLVDSKLLSHIHNPKYRDILISDHCPLTFTLYLSGVHSARPLWRMDPQLVNDPKFSEYLCT